MFIQIVLSLALLGVALAGSVPSTLLTPPKHILQPPLGGTKTVIRGLLSGQISSRQATECDTDHSVCDSNYCCPTLGACCTGGFCCGQGYYCDTVKGMLGCCANGQTCTETSNECSTSGHSPCPNDTYCCPTGDTCFRDSSNTPNCFSGGTSSTSSSSSPASSTSSSGGSSHNGGSAVGSLADIRGVAVISIVGALAAFVL